MSIIIIIIFIIILITRVLQLKQILQHIIVFKHNILIFLRI